MNMKKIVAAVPISCALLSVPVVTFGQFPSASVDEAVSAARFKVTLKKEVAWALKQGGVQMLIGGQMVVPCEDALDADSCPLSDRTFISPLLYEGPLFGRYTKVGRSAPHTEGSLKDTSSGTQICMANQSASNDSCATYFPLPISDAWFQRLSSCPPDLPGVIKPYWCDGNSFDEGPTLEQGNVEVKEVHTQIVSMHLTHLTGSSPGGSANAVRAGRSSYAPCAGRSLGEVESTAPDGQGFPAESFFNMYVEVDIDFDQPGMPGYGQIDMTVFNKWGDNPDYPSVGGDPLIIEATLDAFPPTVVYTHTGRTNDKFAPHIYLKKDGECDVATTFKGINIPSGEIGWIRVAAHGMGFDVTDEAQNETRKRDTRRPPVSQCDDEENYFQCFDRIFNELPMMPIAEGEDGPPCVEDCEALEPPLAGVDSAPSLGRFVTTFATNFIRANPKLQNAGLCTDPDSSICTDEMRTIAGPLLSETQTKIGRSATHKDGADATSTDKKGTKVCKKGNADHCDEFFTETVKDSDFSVVIFPPPTPNQGYGEDGPVGTKEVHTQMLSMNMKNGANAVRAGSAAPDQPRSIGEVESLSSVSPDNAGDFFPAESFFNIYAEVDIDIDFDGKVDFTLYNKPVDPLVVIGTGLQKFPPKLVYTHSGTEWAVPFFEKGGSPAVAAYIVMAGHGMNYSGSMPEDSQTFEGLFEQLPKIAINPEKRAEKEFDPERPTDILNPGTTKCRLYAVQDHGRNNSEFYAITPDSLYVESISKVYSKHDIEGLAAHPTSDILYAASGNDAEDAGHLYRFEVNTAELTNIGDTKFGDVPSIAFDSKGILWGWVKGKGLITIDVDTGQGTMVKEFPDILVEGITWNNVGTHIYGSEDTNLWVYEHATETAKLVCNNLPGETEALEMLPDGTLLLGIHGEKKIIQFQGFNVETCEMVFGVDIPTSPTVNDIEGIAWPINLCSQPD